MTISEELIDAYKKILLNPKEYDLPFIGITDFFEESETVTPKHILTKQYIDHCKGTLSKLVLYVIMNEIYGIGCESENGDFGYKLKVKEVKNAGQ